LLDQAQHVGFGEGLLDEVDRALLQRRDRHRHVAMAGDEDDRQTAAAAVQLLEQLQPAHPRHADVEHDAAGHLRTAHREEGLRRVVRGHGVAVGLEHPHEGIAQGLVVIDDMDDLFRRCGQLAQLRPPWVG